MSSFWVWLIVIGVWSLAITFITGPLLGWEDNYSAWFIVPFGIFILCVVVALIGGTAEWICYMEAWPCRPQ